MTESIDVSNKSPEYLPIFQQKSSSTELKVAEKNSENSNKKSVVAKNQAEKSINNSESDIKDVSEDVSLDYVNKLSEDNDENDNKIAYGSKKNDAPLIAYGSNNSEDLELNLLGDPNYSIMNSYGALAAAVGANTRGVTKMDLITFLERLSSGPSNETGNAEVIAFVKNLIAQFDTLSGGGDYLTSLTGIKEPQDYSTVTKEQVTSPIDLRI